MNPIISALDNYARVLKKASVWQTSKKPIGIIKDTGDDDFIFEFYCYVRIIVDLKKNYKLKYHPGFGDNKNNFPQSPAHKIGRPYFEMFDKNDKLLYQVCAGTKIKVLHGNKFDAPDISFQEADSPSNKPAAKNVKIIMDAKNCNVDKSQFNSFAMMIRNLNTEDAEKEMIKFDKLNAIKGNYLISFGKAYTDDKDYLKFHKLSEIENFDGKNNFNIINY